MDISTVDVLLLVFIATVIRSTFGFGEALIVVPLLALILPVQVAAPLAVLLIYIYTGLVWVGALLLIQTIR